MRTNRVDNTRFGAFYLNTVPIKKVVKGAEPIDVDVSFVQYDPTNGFDLRALKWVQKNWLGYYVDNVYNTAIAMFKKEESFFDMDVCALTFQKDRFDLLNGEDIIGLTEFIHTGKKSVFLEHITGDPMYIGEYPRTYKEIGMAMLTSFKKHFDKIQLVARKSEAVMNFYKKNGFIEFPKDSGHFIWMRDVVSDINSNNFVI